MLRFLRYVVPATLLLTAHTASAEGPDSGNHAADPADIRFFETKIRPVLVKSCYECHSAMASTLQAGLLLDTRAGIRKGGESGPAVVPGKPGESLLLEAIQYDGFEMPPDGKLPAEVIADFRKWIELGASDPRQGGGPGETEVTPVDEAASFWSLQPVGQPSAPDVSDAAWPASEIDRFILARLQAAGVRPAADATRTVLVRRLYVDLLGLPPSPEQQRAFVDSNDPHAYRKLVDRLLDSPHFGERWGRHWLDLARFAESTGGGASKLLPDAWKYRDYAIRSFNDDKPYDQFVREQIAGDLLPGEDVEKRADQLAGTGFLVLGPRSYITDDAAEFRMDGIDEQVDTIGRVFLGMTIGCSRCHDHKFDSITHADYYALAGILGSTQSARPLPDSKNFTWNSVADPREDPDGSRLAAHEAATARAQTLSRKGNRLKRAVATARERGILPDDAQADSVEAWIAGREQELVAMQAELEVVRKNIPSKPATFMGVGCADAPADMRIRFRGNPHRTGEVVRRGFPEVISRSMSGRSARPEIPADQSGRLELADWLASERNPLTARVFVNRVWHHLFGRGIVTTLDNFGTTSELPTHPQLLDWLARRFMDDGWSVKMLVRRIVTSRTYRLGAAGSNEPGERIDPDNRLFGRRTRRSLDAETLRDTMLAVSGELDLRCGGQSFPDRLTTELSHTFQSQRRSVYLPRFRNHQLELFQTFDAANPTLVVGRRDRTVLPTQALFLINNDFVIDRSRKSAKRLLAAEALSTDERIELLYLRTLCRKPSAEEAALARNFVDPAPAAAGSPPAALWSALQQTLFQCIDFRFVK